MKKCVMLFVAALAVALSVWAEAPALNRIDGAGSVRIPQGKTNAEALDAVQASATNRGSWIMGRWTLESRDPSNAWIRVRLVVRMHDLTVCYRVENGLLVPDVPQSTNLNQNGSKIDGHVPGWINRFNQRIEANLRNPQPLAPATPAPAVTNAPASPVAAPAPAQGTPAARFCEGCGKKASPDANFCGACGKKL